MGWPLANSRINKRLLLVGVVVALCVATTMNLLAAAGSRLDNRSLTLSDNQVSATAQYTFRFQPTSTDAIQTVLLQICSNDPFAGTACTPPTGFDATNANLLNQAGDVGFSMSTQSTANQLVLERTVAASTAQPNSYEFDTVINPSTAGSYYVRFQTFAGSDINGPSNNYGGAAFAIASAVDINATVPPYLLFCVGVTVPGFNCNSVSGDYVDFGEFSSRQATQGSTQMLAATNAVDGYTIRVNGHSLTSGNNVIAELTGADVSRPGVSQFGLNLRANTAPTGGEDVSGVGSGVAAGGYNQVNFFRFNSGDVVAASVAPDEARKYTATYMVNVSRDQAPGVYVSTIMYLALGSF
ncbi:MAG: hypothetical protein JWN82_162 [Candidatus Saccharibacteria bacterium]|nr:hypothetical protein [Candidatus Saccharibacteria bacterium]